MVGNLAVEMLNRWHAEPADLYATTRATQWRQRPNLPKRVIRLWR
jgi:hypothetical protein